VASVAPQLWGNEYYRAQLSRALVNVCCELPETKLLDTASFKAMITGDRMTGRFPYGKPFHFLPKAGHLFAANEFPAITDHSLGFWRRIFIVPFNRDFTKDPERVNSRELAAKLKTMTPAVVAWALEGAVRLMQQGEYTIPASHEQAVQQWRLETNNVAAWLEDGQWGYGLAWEPAMKLFDHYKLWCWENGNLPVGSRKFFTRLGDLGVEKRTTNSGKQYQVVGKKAFHVG
jgi:putative DNA primase/helicase